MNQGRKELVRLVRSLEAKDDPRKAQDFSSLPVSLMIRATLQRVFQGSIGKFRRPNKSKK